MKISERAKIGLIWHGVVPKIAYFGKKKRLRAKKCYDIPAATRQAGLTAAVKQDVVKVEILQDHSDQVHDISEPSHVTDTECILPQPETAPIEIRLFIVKLKYRKVQNKNVGNCTYKM